MQPDEKSMNQNWLKQKFLFLFNTWNLKKKKNFNTSNEKKSFMNQTINHCGIMIKLIKASCFMYNVALRLRWIVLHFCSELEPCWSVNMWYGVSKHLDSLLIHVNTNILMMSTINLPCNPTRHTTRGEILSMELKRFGMPSSLTVFSYRCVGSPGNHERGWKW